mmetsp:Transcript_2651/g.4105  ORF Transcript_2651/g.4105 Transcript_2651/m.4105 type:complete len:356 (-) Transcript_2651:1724-2791(-)
MKSNDEGSPDKDLEENAPAASPPPPLAMMSSSLHEEEFHTIFPLQGEVGAPPLPVLTTRDPRVIERWLEENVPAFSSGDKNTYSVLGFDQESIAKPPWQPGRASLPDGPATVQLSTPTSCLIIQLSCCGDGSALHAPAVLREVINNERIIKCGVGIAGDALELYRWSKESFEDVGQHYELKSRFDLGCLLPHKTPPLRAGIKELGETVLGVSLNKSKKISMSNWGLRNLSDIQIAYAARDAWVAAAVIERLQKGNEEVFGTDSLMKSDFMKNQTPVEEMDERKREKKRLKEKLKRKRRYKKVKALEKRERDDSSVDNKKEDEDEERIRELYNGLIKRDQPPTFPEDVFKLPFYTI